MPYIPTDTECSELNPGICGGKLDLTMIDNCESIHIDGVDDVTINQGVGIDLTDGVSAHDATGAEIPFEVDPEEIDKCDVGEHTVTYTAIGADERMLPSLCGENFVEMACSGLGMLIKKRLVTIEQADPPTINGIDYVVMDTNEQFNPLEGVTGVDDNGNPVDVSYYGEYDDYAEGDIASFETDLMHPFRSLQVNLEPVQDGTPWMSTQDTTPYMFRAVPTQTEDFGHESDTIVGGTVGWNQLVRNGNFVDTSVWSNLNSWSSYSASDNTLHLVSVAGQPSYTNIFQGVNVFVNHVYILLAEVKSSKLTRINGSVGTSAGGGTFPTTYYEANTWLKYTGLTKPTSFTENRLYIRPKDTSDAEVVDIYLKNVWLVDLTAYFGTNIADYVYTLESGTAGAGVAWLKKYAPQLFKYNAYDAGSLESVSGLTSHDMVGFNAWDEEWEAGKYNVTTGEAESGTNQIRSKNLIKVLPNTTYFIQRAKASVRIIFCDASGAVISATPSAISDTTFVTPNGCYGLKFYTGSGYGTTYTNDICINLSDASLNGTYKPHTKHSYSLDSTLTLRGIAKLDNGKLYYDGDIYPQSGNGTRRFVQINIADLDFVAYSLGTDRTVYAAAGVVETYGVNAVRTAVPNAFCSNGYTPTYQNASRWNAGEFVFTIFAATLPANSLGFITANGAYASAEAFKTAMANHGIIVEVATPTSFTADPYTNPQVVDPNGTEEYVGSPIPVGHKTTYHRICPITGWTGCKVSVSPYEQTEKHTITGKNIYNAPNNKHDSIVPCHIANGVTVTASCSSSGAGIRYYNANKVQIDYWSLVNVSSDGRYYRNFTSSGGIEYVEFYGANSTNYMIELNTATPSPYEPYGYNYPVSWQTEAGTVYGGTVDVVTGVLTVTDAIKDLGDMAWTMPSANTFRFVLSAIGAKPPATAYVLPNAICSAYTAITASTTASDGEFKLHPTNGYGYFTNSAYSDAAAFKTAMSGIQLVYELATPIEIPLTPQLITALQGENNVWSSEGDVYVEYSKTIPTSGDITYPLDGIYYITYTAVDQCGNFTEQTRILYVGDICAIVDIAVTDDTYVCDDECAITGIAMAGDDFVCPD